MKTPTAPVDRQQPFYLDLDGLHSSLRPMMQLARPTVEKLLAFPDLNRIHERTLSLGGPDRFSECAVAAMDVSMRVEDADLTRIPATGPLVVVANHPFGGLDGVGLIALLQRRRPDVKILANHLLSRIPELREACIFVDPFGGPQAKRRNLAGVRAAIQWVRNGGVLAVFPAGEVSSLNLRSRAVADGPWTKHAAAIIRSAGASVLPIYFSGRNSNSFQCAGLLSPRLRTLMLPRELLKKRGSSLEVHIGSLIKPKRLRQFATDEEVSTYLRLRTYLLAAREKPRKVLNAQSPSGTKMDVVASPQPADQMAEEIDRLPAEKCLARSGSLRVVYASANDLPITLREIGRLREVTFRRVGEGTGRSSDLDRFDQTYLHLLLWNEDTQEVVGAYRMGLADRIIETEGAEGLYTNTLFRFRDDLLDQIGPAIELGRSFVRPEYQKEYAPLALLWKGIACFAARHPRYRRLFGPVSISNEYHSMTRQLLIEFLKHNNAAEDLQKFVSPRNPPHFGPGRGWETRLAATVVRSIEGINELVGEIESDRLGMPVLLRQYLKLNAKLLGFNVDPNFGDVLDGLMLVDLTQVQRSLLVRYMGRENADHFLSYHASVS